jgi:hypothetical protein
VQRGRYGGSEWWFIFGAFPAATTGSDSVLKPVQTSPHDQETGGLPWDRLSATSYHIPDEDVLQANAGNVRFLTQGLRIFRLLPSHSLPCRDGKSECQEGRTGLVDWVRSRAKGTSLAWMLGKTAARSGGGVRGETAAGR